VMRTFSCLFLTASLSLLLTVSALAANNVQLTSEAAKANYSVGYQMGTDFKNQDWTLEPEAMLQGIQDGLDGAVPKMSEAQMKETLIIMKRKLVLAHEQSSINYKRDSIEFLKENAKKEGVVVLPSGVQYKVLQQGKGKSPTLDDTIRIHFKLFKIDGTEVGSTFSNSDPRVEPVANALPGLREVLLLMKEGAVYQIILPSGMAASNRESDDSGASIYEMHLVSIKPKA